MVLNKFLNKTRPKIVNPLINTFLELESDDQFPFTLALRSFENLQNSASSDTELFEHLLEDVIFSSLYATFYEQILLAVRQNQGIALNLIESFATDAEERERGRGRELEARSIRDQ